MKGNLEDKDVSLSEVHRTVRIPEKVGFFKQLLAFAGPAYLVSVGYMDPGNWATDLEGGARFGYQLIWVLLMSNLMAVLLQTLTARMGIATGRDLARACRESYPKPVGYVLWIFAEVAISACDLAEVLGTAIGLNLLFGIPLLYGVILTGFDTLLFLVIQNFGIRKMEAFILSLVATIGICFVMEMIFAKPIVGEVVTGFLPRLTSDSLYVAIGILGATVMPHNLYLHSALVQTRNVDQTEEGKRQAMKFNLFDTVIALNIAFFINAAILVLSSAVFFKNGVVVTEIQQAHELLTPLLGITLASTFFAVALLAAGQSSTLTGTLAGQVVMEGFLRFKIRLWLRRLITRLIAIVPAVLVISIKGEEGSYDLLILSQVILSLQLPFAVVPLIHYTSDKAKMGKFANKTWVQIAAWIAASIIISLNAKLVYDVLGGWIASAGEQKVWLLIFVVPLVISIALLLLYIMLPKQWRFWVKKPQPKVIPEIVHSQSYKRIGAAIDFSEVDNKVLSHAQTLARIYGAELFIFHVVEGVGGQVFGSGAYDEEARDDKPHLETIGKQLAESGLEVHPILGFGRVPTEIIRLSRETKIELLVMGGHRHSGIKDIIFGTTITKVRHNLSIPVLVV